MSKAQERRVEEIRAAHGAKGDHDIPFLLRLLDERTKERDEARALVERASHGWEKLMRWYDGADEELRTKGACGSQHRDGFEAWLDSLVCDATDMIKKGGRHA